MLLAALDDRVVEDPLDRRGERVRAAVADQNWLRGLQAALAQPGEQVSPDAGPTNAEKGSRTRS